MIVKKKMIVKIANSLVVQLTLPGVFKQKQSEFKSSSPNY